MYGASRSKALEGQVHLELAGEGGGVLQVSGCAHGISQKFSAASEPQRAAVARRAMYAMVQRARALKLESSDVQRRLFGAVLDTVVSYGSEVWAPGLLHSVEPCDSSCEHVHLGFSAAPHRRKD